MSVVELNLNIKQAIDRASELSESFVESDWAQNEDDQAFLLDAVAHIALFLGIALDRYEEGVMEEILVAGVKSAKAMQLLVGAVSSD